MRIMVTGSKGFLGQHMVRQLSGRGEIVCVDLPEFDVTDYTNIKQLIKDTKPDIVFHFAGLQVGSYSRLCRVNALGSLNLYDNIYKYSPESRVIVAGSAAEYGFHDDLSIYQEEIETNPVSDYGKSKLMQTLIGEQHFQKGLNITVARIFNIIGVNSPDHLVVPSIIKRVVKLEKDKREKKVIKVGNINCDRDFISLETLGELLWFVALNINNLFIVNACSGEPIKISTIIEELQKACSIRFTYEIDPNLVRPNDRSVVGDTRRLRSLGWSIQNERQKVISEIHKMYLNFITNWGGEYA